MKTGTLNEICKDLDYNRPFHLTFRRRCWDNFNDNYAKVETVDSIDVFVFYGKESNYKPVQLSYHNTIADDWYVVEEETDINMDKLRELLENSIKILNKILENYK